MKESECQYFLLELESVEALGVTIWLDGSLSNPDSIVGACTVNEECCYMRDYIHDEEGVWKELRFDKIEKK